MASAVEQMEPGGLTAAEQNARCIARLYDALERKDPAAAAACYAATATFEDIGFQLTGRTAIERMWDLVCTADGFRAEPDPSSIEADATAGKGAWIAYYAPLIPGSGYAEVRNPSSSIFGFAGPGLITTHQDVADPKAWAEMAFPYPISLLAGKYAPVRHLFAQFKLTFHSRRHS